MAAKKKLPDGMIKGPDRRHRCWWCGDHEDYRAYHDEEWGVPTAEDRRLYEKLCLEGFQSGLSWLTILRKRENFRRAFSNFEFEEVARFGKRDTKRLLGDAGIVRHRGKIEAAIHNASRALDLVEEAGSIAAFVWQFEPPASARPQRIDKKAMAALAKTAESTALSKALRKRGWKFVGPTTAYAFMQSVGLVNDHLEGCWRRKEIEKLRRSFERP